MTAPEFTENWTSRDTIATPTASAPSRTPTHSSRTEPIPLRITWSPRFGKNLPLIDNVPDREGIRIHLGTKPSHSTGCVLVSPFGLSAIEAFINYHKKYYEDEDIRLTVRSI